MLTILTSNGEEHNFHVGQERDILALRLTEISLIEADGDELQHILSRFTIANQFTIPVPNKRICRWYGDIAKTIWINW